MTDPFLVARLRLASVACSTAGAFAGLTALLGWITGNEVLKGAFVACSG